MWARARGGVSVILGRALRKGKGFAGVGRDPPRRLSVPPSISLRTNGQPCWAQPDALGAQDERTALWFSRTRWGRRTNGQPCWAQPDALRAQDERAAMLQPGSGWLRFASGRAFESLRAGPTRVSGRGCEIPAYAGMTGWGRRHLEGPGPVRRVRRGDIMPWRFRASVWMPR